MRQDNYYGIHINNCMQHLNCDKYIGDVELDTGKTVAMFYSSNPDTEKGHKKFPYILINELGSFIGALDEEEFNKIRVVSAIECLHCKDIIYSRNKHDFRYCSCNKVAIDGGRSYTRITGNYLDYKSLLLDLFTREEITYVQ